MCLSIMFWVQSFAKRRKEEGRRRREERDRKRKRKEKGWAGTNRER